MRINVRLLLSGVCYVLFAVTPVAAQLTSEEIVELQEQGVREGWTFTVGENPATQYPIDQICGLKVPDELPVPPDTNRLRSSPILPDIFDWRDEAGQLPVRNQGRCGSCWAFSSIGALEWAILIHDGGVVDLSEQWLVSCDEGSLGCSGGWLAFDLFMSENDPCGHTGAVLEADFPYAAADLPCACPYPHQYFIDTWGGAIDLGGVYETDEIKQAIMTYGPVSCYVSVTAAFQAYTGGVFNACDGVNLNHAVVLVGWDDTQGANGVWIMRNSWGPGWGEQGHMRIEYGCSRIGTNASYLVYTGPKNPAVSFAYPSGIPDTVKPFEETRFIVEVAGRFNGTPMPGSGQLHYCVNHEPVQTTSMAELSTVEYEASLPRIACDDTLEYYVSAEEESGERYYDPDPSSPRTVAVNSEESTIFKDNFFTDLGWVVYGDATEGMWTRGNPKGHGDRCDPMIDYDNGFCYLTGNVDDDSDIEGGVTYLESPAFDLSAGDARIRYARWFCNNYGGGARDDIFVVEISSDNGTTWNIVETVGPRTDASGGWITHEFWASEFTELTGQMKLRFSAGDLGDSSIVEAAVDAVSVTRYACYQCQCNGYCDLNLDGMINPVDVVILVNFVYKNVDSRLQLTTFCPGVNGDWNCDYAVNPVDVIYYVNYVYKSVGVGPENPCIK